MDGPISGLPRRVIPRWRSLVQTIAQGELQPPLRQQRSRKHHTDENLVTAERNWRIWKTDHAAGDFVAAALFSSTPEVASEAASFLLRKSSAASILSREMAEQLLNVHEDSSTVQVVDNLTIARLRRALNINILDAYRWVDLGLLYTGTGQVLKADRALRVALGLAKNDRFVLRALTRFKVHQKEPGEALSLLQRSERLRFDPWLLAAYLATATLADAPLRFYKEAKGLTGSDNFSPFDRSELQAALATVQLNNGNAKTAKKLFEQALVAPTENVVAQASWVVSQSHLSIKPTNNTPSKTFEADAVRAFFTADWKTALSKGTDWQNDEPFSSRAATLSSFIACTAFRDFEEGKDLATRGLVANPTDRTLLNNLAFCQACSGDLELAKRNLKKASEVKSVGEPHADIVLSATAGLIAFRENRTADGRLLYAAAVASAKKMNILSREAMAQAFWAQEEFLAGTEKATEVFDQAAKLAKDRPEPEVKVVFEQLEKLRKGRESS
jgi:tetratricopeptide (TPR) repeat protein